MDKWVDSSVVFYKILLQPAISPPVAFAHDRTESSFAELHEHASLRFSNYLKLPALRVCMCFSSDQRLRGRCLRLTDIESESA